MKRNRPLPKRLTNAALCLPLLMTPMLSLQACENAKAPPAATIRTVLAQNSPATRKAEIRRQLAALCPATLSDDDLERAASYVEAHRDKGAIWIVGRLSHMDAETRICRNIKQ